MSSHQGTRGIWYVSAKANTAKVARIRIWTFIKLTESGFWGFGVLKKVDRNEEEHEQRGGPRRTRSDQDERKMGRCKATFLGQIGQWSEPVGVVGVQATKRGV